MSTTNNIDINLYIDNTLIQKISRNEERPDVLRAINGYGGSNVNPIPGFNFNVDSSNVNDGIHILKIEVKNKENLRILTSESLLINVKKYDAIMYIDNPEYNETVGATMGIRRLGNV